MTVLAGATETHDAAKLRLDKIPLQKRTGIKTCRTNKTHLEELCSSLSSGNLDFMQMKVMTHSGFSTSTEKQPCLLSKGRVVNSFCKLGRMVLEPTMCAVQERVYMQEV